MTFKLNPKLVPFLIKEKGTDKLMAKLVTENGTESVIQLDDGVIATIKSKDLNVKMGKSLSAKLYFDAEGNLVNFELSEPPKAEKPARQGCSTKLQVPEFK